jgi:predicted  nucleic acid-binding Zn-ribbon protein
MENQRINDILNTLNFDRKRPATAAQKAAYERLQKDVDDARQRLNKLHIQLWHAVDRHDYHSLSLEDARETLGDIAEYLEAIAGDK